MFRGRVRIDPVWVNWAQAVLTDLLRYLCDGVPGQVQNQEVLEAADEWRNLQQAGSVDLPLLDLDEPDQTCRQVLRQTQMGQRDVLDQRTEAVPGRYLPLLLFYPENQPSIFRLQLFPEAGQNRPVLPDPDTQPGPERVTAVRNWAHQNPTTDPGSEEPLIPV